MDKQSYINIYMSVDLGNAVSAVIASRKGSFLEAQGYEDLLSHELTQDEWDVAHEIANDYEKREGLMLRG